MQTTLRTSLRFDGIGLHGGRPARVTLHPAPAGLGIRFRRTDIRLGDALIPARWNLVEPTPLCTRLVNPAGVSIATVEHLMAALAGCGVHNVLIEVDGPEVPILDGSSAPFVQAILRAGVRRLAAPVEAIEVLRPVEVRRGEAWARLEPSDRLRMRFHIDFADAAIGVQDKALDLSNGAFVRELCDARTFCRNADVEAMRANGLALGGTLENAVVVEGAQVLSPGGLRHTDEAVRHKMLDALGDLALAGAPLLACYTGHRAGHTLTNALLRQLFAAPDAFRRLTCDAPTAARLPGVGAALREMPAVA